MSRSPWFVKTETEAMNIFIDYVNAPVIQGLPAGGGNFLAENLEPFATNLSIDAFAEQARVRNNPAASPISLTTDERMRKKFPFFQKAKGDGACFANASFAAIFNDCVGSAEKWKNLRNQILLIDKGLAGILNDIGDENTVLTRELVSDLSQARGGQNVIVRLNNALLVGRAAELKNGVIERLRTYWGRGGAFPKEDGFVNQALEDLERIMTEAFPRNDQDVGGNQEVFNRITGYLVGDQNGNLRSIFERFIKYQYSERNGIRCTTYDAEDLSPMFEFLYPSKKIISVSRGTLATIPVRPDQIYLWNADGAAHFDVLYPDWDGKILEEAKQEFNGNQQFIQNLQVARDTFLESTRVQRKFWQLKDLVGKRKEIHPNDFGVIPDGASEKIWIREEENYSLYFARGETFFKQTKIGSLCAESGQEQALTGEDLDRLSSKIKGDLENSSSEESLESFSFNFPLSLNATKVTEQVSFTALEDSDEDKTVAQGEFGSEAVQNNAEQAPTSALPSATPEPIKVATLMNLTKVREQVSFSAWMSDSRRANNYRTKYCSVKIGRQSLSQPQDIMNDILMDIARDKKYVKNNNDGNDLTLDQLQAIILFAKFQGGVTNKKNQDGEEGIYSEAENDFPFKKKQFLELEDTNLPKGVKEAFDKMDRKLIKNVSALFQKKCQSYGILSGRKYSQKGLRLTFLPEAVRQSLADNFNSSGFLKEDALGEVGRINDVDDDNQSVNSTASNGRQP